MYSEPLATAITYFKDGNTSAAVAHLQNNISDFDCKVRLREYYIGERLIEAAMPLVQNMFSIKGVEADVSKSIAAIIQGDLNTAINAAQRAIDILPNLATAHNHLARALFNAGEVEKALEHFKQAIKCDPNYSEAFHNIAMVKRAIGDFAGAIDFYSQSLKLNKGYRSSKLNMAITLSLIEQYELAFRAFTELEEEYPNDLEVLINVGLSYQTFGDLESAQAYYEKVISVDGKHAQAYCYLGILLNEKLDTEGAVSALQTAIALNPQELEAICELTNVYEKINQLEQAQTALAQGLSFAPQHPMLLLESAKLNRRAQDIDAALNALSAIDPSKLLHRQALEYYFELGTVQDRKGLFDEAFVSFTMANQHAAANPRRKAINPKAFYERCDQIKSWVAKGAPGNKADKNELKDTGKDLCFLIGFPRSGTTLLDTMLAVHPDIVSLEELPTLEKVISSIENSDTPYTEVLSQQNDEFLEQYRQQYRQQLDQHLDDYSNKIVLDKLPMRSIHVGLIQRLFPDAKLLFSHRHPGDVLISNFMQSYVPNEAFIHFDTLEDSAKIYAEVMQVWTQLTPNIDLAIHYSAYESLLNNTNTELERICEFLGISMSEDMTNTESRLATRTRVRTNSYHQVSQDLYTRSINRWQNYEKHISPFLKDLDEIAKAFSYELPK